MAIVETTRPITGGVDTHLDVHVAAALDANGGVLGVESFPTTAPGLIELAQWLGSFGTLERVGVEGTGAYGAGLARYLRSLDVAVIEVDRPNRQLRRSKGKSDVVDAVEAGRPVLSGRATGIAKSADGNTEALRVALIAKRPTQPGRQPPSQPCPVADRVHPHGQRRTHTRVRRAPCRGGTLQARDDADPQALRGR